MATMTSTSASSPIPRGNATKRMTSASHSVSVTPGVVDEDGFNHRMTVEKGIVDELLLVCGVIGSSATDPNNEDELIPVTDCLNWLQDLQRALRRDDDTYRPISLLIGNWKVVQQKLLPLVMNCRYDTPMVLTIVKILVILTKPISETTRKAGRMVIDTKSRKVDEDVIQEQIKLRENAVAQSDILMEYKRAIVHHSSHLRSKKNSHKNNKGGLLSIFVSLLAEPLSKTGTARSETDHLTIELVLHLFRNLLSAEPILKGSSEASQRSALLHQEIVSLFERELVLDIFLVLAQGMESRENAQYNLLMMELLHHLLRNQDPTAVARSILPDPTNKKKTNAKGKETALLANNGTSRGSLRAKLDREKKQFSAIQASRHSHFGGTLVAKRHDGKRQYLSASQIDKKNEPPEAAKKKNRRTEPFVGSGRTFAAHTRGATAGEDGPAALRAQRTLYNFCGRFIEHCYGPVMKSLKNEFRRDSVRLEEGDKVVFFRIVWFFCQWWRVSGAGRPSQPKGKDPKKESQLEGESQNTLGQLIFTMDVFTFNLVLNATDTFQQHKKFTQLAQAVSLCREMMQMLFSMHQSKDTTESIMALGLLDRLFYGSDPLDRLPKLLSKWTPGSSTREYLCDLVELTHVSLKMVDANAKACLKHDDAKEGATDAEKKKSDTVSVMKATASEFDVTAYIGRKIVSNNLIFMYTHLLSQYLVNSPQVNHHIIALFVRLCKMKVVASDDGADSALEPAKTVTLQPMLYNIQLMAVLNVILNDTSIRNDKENAALISFATSIMIQFSVAAKENAMLHVECLFRHPAPHRFCELSSNMYVNEELRMIAERELLLEESRRVYGEEGDDNDEIGPQKGDDIGGTASRIESRSTLLSSAADNDDEEETEWADADDKLPRDTSMEMLNVSSKKTKKVANYASADKERENEYHLERDSLDLIGEKEDDSKWSDRRAFVPKRMVVKAAKEPGSSDSETHDETEPVEKKQRLRKIGGDDDSDDDDFDFKFGSKSSHPVVSDMLSKASSRLVIEDDDED